MSTILKVYGYEVAIVTVGCLCTEYKIVKEVICFGGFCRKKE